MIECNCIIVGHKGFVVKSVLLDKFINNLVFVKYGRFGIKLDYALWN
jgi:hypothetical protein